MTILSVCLPVCRWRENQPSISMAAMTGIKADLPIPVPLNSYELFNDSAEISVAFLTFQV